MRPFKGKKRAEGPNRNEALDCIPIKTDQIEEIRVQNGVLLLSYPVAIRPWLGGMIKRLGGNRDRKVLKKLQLDSLGTEVWELMDGKSRVRDVVQRFAAAHRLPLGEAEVAVTRFIRDLGRRGLIGLR